jgi:broad specificity phosphatase PhoE
MRKAVLVRHGKTLHNSLGLIQGKTDTDLSEEGEAQARLLAEELCAEPFDFVYSSPLLRAYRTAQIILEKRNIPISADNRLAEIDQGKWTLQNAGELFKNDARYKEWVKNPTLIGPPDGETIFDVRGRCESFLSEMQGNNVLIVAHAGLIAVMRSVMQSYPIEKVWELLPRNGEAVRLSF